MKEAINLFPIILVYWYLYVHFLAFPHFTFLPQGFFKYHFAIYPN